MEIQLILIALFPRKKKIVSFGYFQYFQQPKKFNLNYLTFLGYLTFIKIHKSKDNNVFQSMIYKASFFTPYKNINTSKGEILRVLCKSIFKRQYKSDDDTFKEFQGTFRKLKIRKFYQNQ